MLTLNPGALTLNSVRDFYHEPSSVVLTDDAQAQIATAAQFVLDVSKKDNSTYGINTGFGKLAQTRIAPEKTAELQHALLKSHSTGVGPPMPLECVRLALLTKINALHKGIQVFALYYRKSS